MIKKEKKPGESNPLPSNKASEKSESKTADKNEKLEKIVDTKTDKISRPVKWNKNKHSFVVSGN
jgi:hypothetical protein